MFGEEGIEEVRIEFGTVALVAVDVGASTPVLHQLEVVVDDLIVEPFTRAKAYGCSECQLEATSVLCNDLRFDL